MYKILIADDHPLVREAIVNVVQDSFKGSEALESNSLSNTMDTAAEHDDLDLILLDLNMPGMEGLNGLVSLRKSFPTIPVVMISAEEDKQVVLQSMSYGSVGFITKSLSREEIASAIKLILNGSVYLPSDILRAEPTPGSETSMTATISPELLSSLTRRQMLVLERLSKGESNKQIAFNLNIAETTVKAHVSAILRKLRVCNRIQAVLSTSNMDFSQYLKK